MKKRKKIISLFMVVMVSGIIFSYWILKEDDIDRSKYTISNIKGNIEFVQWEPKGARIAILNEWYGNNTNREHHLIIWNHSSKRIEKTIDNHDGFLYGPSLSWSPDGSMLAVGCVDANDLPQIEFPEYARARIRIFNTTSWEIIKTLNDNFTIMVSLDWSWDGNYLGGTDAHPFSNQSNLLIWETAHWKNIIFSRVPRIMMLKWNPLNYSIATGNYDSTVRIYNIQGFPFLTLTGHDYRVQTIAWSPNGTFLASGSFSQIIIWETIYWTKNAEYQISEYEGFVNKMDMDWNYDGTSLGSSCSEKIFIWSINQKKCSDILQGHEYEIESLSWSKSTNLIATGSSDGTVKFWKV